METTIMEDQMEKQAEHEMEARMFKSYLRIICSLGKPLNPISPLCPSLSLSRAQADLSDASF